MEYLRSIISNLFFTFYFTHSYIDLHEAVNSNIYKQTSYSNPELQSVPIQLADQTLRRFYLD